MRRPVHMTMRLIKIAEQKGILSVCLVDIIHAHTDPWSDADTAQRIHPQLVHFNSLGFVDIDKQFRTSHDRILLIVRRFPLGNPFFIFINGILRPYRTIPCQRSTDANHKIGYLGILVLQNKIDKILFCYLLNAGTGARKNKMIRILIENNSSHSVLPL